MRVHEYASCAAPQIRSYVRSRMAADAICESAEENLHLFDAHCARDFAGATVLTQEMVDSWCARRPTESAFSCYARCRPVAALVAFLRARGETDVAEPDLPRPIKGSHVPHAFTEEELSGFFALCDSWEPRNGMRGKARLRTKLTLPVIFRLLWSSGLRTCEARLLRRANADLGTGVLRIVEGKGRSERVVALHPSMAAIMRDYDASTGAVFPGRVYFFPNGTDGHISSGLLGRWFRTLWRQVSDERATAYDLRHAFCVECVNSLVGRGVDGLADLEWVSKAMGHATVEETVRSYYHIVPSLAALLQERSEAGFDDLMPGVV